MNTRKLDTQAPSTENESLEVAGKFQDGTTATSATSQKEFNAEELGRVYFIRHGESTSNERNIFAGVLDVDLTSFGRWQARRAGVDLKKKGTKFDAVYSTSGCYEVRRQYRKLGQERDTSKTVLHNSRKCCMSPT